MSIEAKQNAIKEAYGEYFEICKPDENGWSHRQLPAILDIEFGDGNASDFFRPKSLSGIEDNNGWIKIESEDYLPKEYGYYWAIDNSELIQEVFIDDIKVGFYTHYQPIIKPKPPIY